MALSNDVVLRPRFNFEVEHDMQTLQTLFESVKTNSSNIVVHCLDEHVYLKIPKSDQHYWSPQLHLEFLETDQNHTKLFGVFGPNPTVWTLFMFLHFVVAGLFIGFGIWSYTNWSLGNDYVIPVFLTILMVLIWFVLYFAGRLGKRTGMDQMHQLHHFMRDTLRTLKK